LVIFESINPLLIVMNVIAQLFFYNATFANFRIILLDNLFNFKSRLFVLNL